MQDHEQVLRYPPVQGMAKNVFFWDHNHPEGGNDDTKSKVNPGEANLAARLAFYLKQQGYKEGEITILTPYVGQLRLISQAVAKYVDILIGDSDNEQLALLVGSQICAACVYELSQPLLYLICAHGSKGRLHPCGEHSSFHPHPHPHPQMNGQRMTHWGGIVVTPLCVLTGRKERQQLKCWRLSKQHSKRYQPTSSSLCA